MVLQQIKYFVLFQSEYPGALSTDIATLECGEGQEKHEASCLGLSTPLVCPVSPHAQRLQCLIRFVRNQALEIESETGE